MSYFFHKIIKGQSFERVIESVTEQLQIEGFGVVTNIDFQLTFRNKLGVDIPRYTVLGACNPPAAKKAIDLEKKIGVFLPCNVVIEENEQGDIEVAIVDPVASMQAVENEGVNKIANEIAESLKKVIDQV